MIVRQNSETFQILNIQLSKKNYHNTEFLTAAKDKKNVTGVKVIRLTALVVVAAFGTDSFPGLNARGAGSMVEEKG